MREGRPLLEFRNVTKSFGGFLAVDGVSLSIGEGAFFALLGPSGCGKTTLLRMVAGFDAPDSGAILLDGADLGATPPHRRPVNMMFQSYALFPHLSVAENIAFGLKREGMAAGLRAGRVADMVRLARLEGLETRRPHQLSGGQKQRVALARALAKRPRLLLLDEPMAALDKKLREETQLELKEIQQRLGLAFIIVTHDQAEAMTLAGRIGVMDRGRLAQVGSPRDIYERPQTRFVASFVGDVNLIEGQVAGPARFFIAGLGEVAVNTEGAACGARATLALRPERLRMAAGAVGENRLAGQVVDSVYLGGATMLRVCVAGGHVLRVAGGAEAQGVAPGDAVTLAFDARDGALLAP